MVDEMAGDKVPSDAEVSAAGCVYVVFRIAFVGGAAIAIGIRWGSEYGWGLVAIWMARAAWIAGKEFAKMKAKRDVHL